MGHACGAGLQGRDSQPALARPHQRGHSVSGLNPWSTSIGQALCEVKCVDATCAIPIGRGSCAEPALVPVLSNRFVRGARIRQAIKSTFVRCLPCRRLAWWSRPRWARCGSCAGGSPPVPVRPRLPLRSVLCFAKTIISFPAMFRQTCQLFACVADSRRGPVDHKGSAPGDLCRTGNGSVPSGSLLTRLRYRPCWNTTTFGKKFDCHLLCICAAKMEAFEQADCALELLRAAAAARPAVDASGAVLAPLPAAHRAIASPACLPHVVQVCAPLLKSVLCLKHPVERSWSHIVWTMV